MKKDNTQNNGNSFTRGSQVFAHSWRMKMQGFKTAAWISAGIVMLWWAFQCWRKLLLIDLYYAPTILWSYIKLDIGEIFYKPQEIWITVYDFTLQKYRYLSCLEFHDRIWKSPIGQRLMAFWDWLMPSAMIESIIVFAVGMIGVYWFFAHRGRKNMGKETLTG